MVPPREACQVPPMRISWAATCSPIFSPVNLCASLCLGFKANGAFCGAKVNPFRPRVHIRSDICTEAEACF